MQGLVIVWVPQYSQAGACSTDRWYIVIPLWCTNICAGVLATHFVQLEAGHDVVQQRSTGRQVDAATGGRDTIGHVQFTVKDIYHSTFHPAPEGAETVAEGPTDIVSFSHYQEHAAGACTSLNICGGSLDDTGVSQCYSTMVRMVNADQPKVRATQRFKMLTPSPGRHLRSSVVPFVHQVSIQCSFHPSGASARPVWLRTNKSRRVLVY